MSGLPNIGTWVPTFDTDVVTDDDDDDDDEEIDAEDWDDGES